MPTFEVTLRYRLEWTASRMIKAKNEEAAQAVVENQFHMVNDYASFEQFVAKDSTPELEEETLEVDQIEEI